MPGRTLLASSCPASAGYYLHLLAARGSWLHSEHRSLGSSKVCKDAPHFSLSLPPRR